MELIRRRGSEKGSRKGFSEVMLQKVMEGRNAPFGEYDPCLGRCARVLRFMCREVKGR